jgi:hypothetical protein
LVLSAETREFSPASFWDLFMVKQTTGTAPEAIIAAWAALAVFLAAGEVSARAGGLSSHHVGRFGLSRGHGLCGLGCKAFAHRHIQRFPQAIVGDGWYGFYGASDGVLPDVYGIGTSVSAPIPILPAVKSGPSCHLETQTYVVPSEAGGERHVAITRCVTAAATPLNRQSASGEP